MDIMVDIETMDTEPTAAVLSIGAVIFDPFYGDTQETIRGNNTRCFYTAISLESNIALGRTMSPSTVLWWMQQTKAAQDAFLAESRANLSTALNKFLQFVAGQSPTPDRVWAKGPDFDCVTLQSAMKSASARWPFKYHRARCVRTIMDVAYPDGDFPKIGVGTAHNALDDAILQTLCVQHAYHTIHRK